MSRVGRGLFSFSQYFLCRGTRIHGTSTRGRLSHGRNLALTSQSWAESKKSADDEEEEEVQPPIKFSTSKASHKTWNVDKSLGSSYERPWWKVVPISVFGVVFMLWCILRRETNVDEQLEKQLYEHLPGLLSDDDEEPVQKKAS